MLIPGKSQRAGQGGFLLIEALISILIFSMGVIALVGLQSMSINNTLHGKYRTEASYLVNSLIGQMMVDQTNVAAYADSTATSPNRIAWNADVAAALPNGASSVLINGTAVTVVVSWRNPDETQAHNYTALAQVAF